MITTGTLYIAWSDGEQSAHHVQAERSAGRPPYGSCWERKDGTVEYAAWTGYYRFLRNGTVTLDDGVRVRTRKGVAFSYDKVSVSSTLRKKGKT